MAKKVFKAQGLRALLATLLVIVILGGGALFYLGLTFVKEYSVEVNHRIADSEASGTQVQQLQELRGQLAESESLVSKVNQLFASPSTYQTQALNDLKNYANQVGFSIASTEFGDPSTNGVYDVTITLGGKVTYSKLIQFLTLLESNLPKMQVAAMSLSHKDGGGADDVVVGDIKINIAVR